MRMILTRIALASTLVLALATTGRSDEGSLSTKELDFEDRSLDLSDDQPGSHPLQSG